MATYSYYETLGVQKTATSDEIKKAYRKLAAFSHPDRGGTPALFGTIQEAYDTLSDASKRAAYDRSQSGAPKSSSAPPQSEQHLEWKPPPGRFNDEEQRSYEQRKARREWKAQQEEAKSQRYADNAVRMKERYDRIGAMEKNYKAVNAVLIILFIILCCVVASSIWNAIGPDPYSIDANAGFANQAGYDFFGLAGGGIGLAILFAVWRAALSSIREHRRNKIEKQHY
jgi:curved DNA-binding protein CbpA